MHLLVHFKNAWKKKKKKKRKHGKSMHNPRTRTLLYLLLYDKFLDNAWHRIDPKQIHMLYLNSLCNNLIHFSLNTNMFFRRKFIIIPYFLFQPSELFWRICLWDIAYRRCFPNLKIILFSSFSGSAAKMPKRIWFKHHPAWWYWYLEVNSDTRGNIHKKDAGHCASRATGHKGLSRLWPLIIFNHSDFLSLKKSHWTGM